MSFASVTASAILARILVTPVAPASVSHSAAPVPMARNSASAGFLATGVRLRGVSGAGGKWAGSILGFPGVVSS